MSKSTAISRRIEKCIQAATKGDHESALINLFPAMDRTAKKRRPKDRVGARIRGFVADELRIITAVGTGNIYEITVNGLTFPQVIYKFGRSAMLHEGELDKRLQFNDTGAVQIGDIWNLPSSFINAMTVAVVIAPENAGEPAIGHYGVTVCGQMLMVNNLWGQRELVKKLVCDQFGRKDVFDL